MDPLVPLSAKLYFAASWINFENLSKIIIIIICILIGAFFAASETAISQCNRFKLTAWAEAGNRRSKVALRIIENFDNSIISILIWINIAHIIPATLATFILVDILVDETIASIISTVVMTIIIFFFSETLPKLFANHNADRLAINLAFPLYFMIIILKPFSLFFQGIVYCIKKIFKINDDENIITEDDFQDTVEDIQEEGKLDENESELIQNAVEFSDFSVLDVMTPINKLIAYDASKASRRDVLNFLKQVEYSRIPVYDETIDNIIGVLHVKKYLVRVNETKNYFNFRSILTKAVFVDADTKIDDMVEIFRNEHIHMAFVRDKNTQKTIGMLTMEDAIEKLVGDIDEKNPPKVFEGGNKK